MAYLYVGSTVHASKCDGTFHRARLHVGQGDILGVDLLANWLVFSDDGVKFSLPLFLLATLVAFLFFAVDVWEEYRKRATGAQPKEIG